MDTKIHGIDRLIAMRRAGKRPELVFIMFVDGCRLFSCDVGVSPAANVERLDLRPFVGLDVLLLADRYSVSAFRLFERLHEFAATVVLSVVAWLPDDMGLFWARDAAEPRPFGQVREEVSA